MSFPLDYWNGLGIFLALGIPILLEVAGDAAIKIGVRNAAVAVLPALGVGMYLTSSRGAIATALVGAFVLIAFSRDRWSPIGALLGGVAGVAITFILLRSFGLLDTLIGSGGSRRWAIETIVVGIAGCAAAAAVAAALRRPAISRIESRVSGRTLGAVAVVLLVAGALLVHPVRRFESFKVPPPPAAPSAQINSHLFSSNGSGRWQFWAAAIHQFRAHPLNGTGAGTYEEWWLQHRTIAVYVRDAHSLWLEVLGELGLVGFLLISVPFAAAILVGARRIASRPVGDGAPLASALAVVVAYCVAAGIDWMWELTAVSVPAFLCLGLLARSDSVSPRRPQRAFGRGAGAVRRWLPAAICVLAAAGLLYAQAIVLVADRDIRASQEASRDGRFAFALSKADRARRVEPWASTPYLQRALILERLGQLGEAASATSKAIRRDPNDWRLWLVAARVQTEQGAIGKAVRSLRQAERLDPHSPFTVGG